MVLLDTQQSLTLHSQLTQSSINLFYKPSTKMVTNVQASIAIPYLKANESIREWSKGYHSATAMFDDAQRIALLPVYVNRSQGEREIARIAATKSTFNAAIDELELLIDGTSSVISNTKLFFQKEPRSMEAHEITACYFEMKVLADKAKIPNSVVLKRFLTFFKQGDAFYKDNAARIDKADKSELTDEEILALVKEVQPKYIKSGKEAADGKIKDEILRFDELKQELSEVKEELYYMKQAQGENCESEEDEVMKFGYSTQGKSKPSFRSQACGVCGMYNHVTEKCYKASEKKKSSNRITWGPCTICGKDNHDTAKCWKRNKTKRSG